MKSTLGPTFAELMAQLPPERRARVEAKGENLIAKAKKNLAAQELKRSRKAASLLQEPVSSDVSKTLGSRSKR